MTPSDLAPYDILIVDDSNAILSHVLNTLNSPQFRCRVARTAQSGLEQIRTRLPDLLLLDCQLDGSHKGSEVLAGCPSPHAPVTIVFSASAEEADTMFHRFEQVSSRILKPFSNDELRTHVREALEENADTIAAIRRALEAVETVGTRSHPAPAPAEPAGIAELCSPPPLAPPPPTWQPSAAQLTATAIPVEEPAAAAETDEILLQSFLGSPGLQRELASSLRNLLGLSSRPLATGPACLLAPSHALQWALHQPQMVAITLRDTHEVIEAYVAGFRVLGVASDAWAGAVRGQVRPPTSDPEGSLQHDALLRMLMTRETGRVEVRELECLPAWTLQQPPGVTARLGSWGAVA